MIPEPLSKIFRMGREEAEREFTPYFYQYFKYYFESPARLNQYAQFCKHIFDMVQGNESRILDTGCGFGLVSIHLATFGAQMVSAVDANEEKIHILQKILSRFNPPITNIEVKLSDALNLEYEDNQFDAVVANEIVSHIRDLDIFIREMSRVLRSGGIFFISDGNNTFDITGRYRRREFWRKREFGPVDEASIRGTEKPVPWLLVRREVIQRQYPQIDTEILDLLAKETAGMYGDGIFRAVEEYLKMGKVLNKPAFKYRDPITGEYNELEFNPYALKGKLEKLGFSARLAKPFFTKSPQRSLLKNLAIYGLRVSHPLSLIVVPTFTIVATKK